ncbi:MAG: hypothetical protein NTW29_07195 [Bacteroidetes bacterium]|nr:hypothetical protein [Bacteroidota bacterium]
MRFSLLLFCFLFFTKAYSQHYTDYLIGFDNQYNPLEQILPDDDGLYHHLLRITISDSVRYKKMIVCQVENANYHEERTRFKPDTIRKEVYYFDSIHYRLIRHEMVSRHGHIIRTYQDELPLVTESYNFGKLQYTEKYFHTGTRLDSAQMTENGSSTTRYFGTNYTAAQIKSGVKIIAHQYNDSAYFVLRYNPRFGELPEPFMFETKYPSLHVITRTLLRPRAGFTTERIAATTDTIQHTIIRLDKAGNVVYKYTKDYTNEAVFEYYFYYDQENKLIRVKNNYNRLHFYLTYAGKKIVRVEIKGFDNMQHCIHLFNEQGYCISKKCIDSEEMVKYTFDQKGNWVRKENYFSGKLFDVVTRQITY